MQCTCELQIVILFSSTVCMIVCHFVFCKVQYLYLYYVCVCLQHFMCVPHFTCCELKIVSFGVRSYWIKPMWGQSHKVQLIVMSVSVRKKKNAVVLLCMSAYVLRYVALSPSCRLLENSAILDQYERASLKYEKSERRFTPAWCWWWRHTGRWIRVWNTC